MLSEFIFVQTGYINLENCGASFRVYILYRSLFQQICSMKPTVHTAYDVHLSVLSLKKDCITLQV